jgi:hypothetical protein
MWIIHPLFGGTDAWWNGVSLHLKQSKDHRILRILFYTITKNYPDNLKCGQFILV